MKMDEIAKRLTDHLKRFEADPNINKRDGKYRLSPYYCANATASGPRIFVRYISFQGVHSLTKQQAQAYLEWLDAGNIGKLWEFENYRRKV